MFSEIEFGVLPLAIQIALVLIVVALIGTSLAYFFILYNRFRGAVYERKKKVLKPMYDELIVSNIVLHPEAHSGISSEYIAEITQQFESLPNQSKVARRILAKQLINYRKNIRGTIGDAIRNLYIDLGFDKQNIKLLRSGNWNVQVTALHELVDMDIPVADVTLLPLTNSHNRDLRSAARHAYIKLSKNDPFKFFDVVTEPLLMWDQIELFRIITTTESIAIPTFARWITYSSNKSIVSFCLKLMVHYNQLAAVPAVIKLLDTKDHFLRADAINALGKMEASESEEKLIYIYPNQPLICQLEILKAIGRFRSSQHLDFLKREFLYTSSFDIRKNAAKSIVKTVRENDPFLKELLDNATAENLIVLKHCMNPLIRN